MNEQFIQFLWKHALFGCREGIASTGEQIHIREVGIENLDAGPDFSNARIQIDGTLWVGNVEIHLRASDWYRHGHDRDPVYGNVILHVVLEDDRETLTHSGRLVPTFVLHFPDELYRQYYTLMNNPGWIPCAGYIEQLDPLALEIWLQELLVDRLEKKADGFRTSLEQSKGDWEEVFYRKLLRAFGNPVNAEPFERLALALPRRILLRHNDRLRQLEALLFGQAGFLEQDHEDQYSSDLAREYRHLAAKYDLTPLPPHIWHFARLRPVHFPTVRLAQLAALLHREPLFLSKCREVNDFQTLHDLFRVPPSAYWQEHYRFGQPAPRRSKMPGESFVRSVLNNVVIPYRYAYGSSMGEGSAVRGALDLLAMQPPEKNRITRNWEKLGLQNTHAASSQALIHLKKEYCIFKRCLRCQIGRIIISG